MIAASLIRRAFLCGLGVGLFVASGTVEAADPVLAALRAELAARSAELAGSTDSADVKLKKAIDKAIAVLDAGSGDLSTELKAAAKVTKSLEKVYAEEFAANGEIATVVNDALAAFESEIRGLLGELEGDVVEAGGGDPFSKVDALIAKAELLLTAADAAAVASALAKGLQKALKVVIQGRKAFEKATTGSLGRYYVVAKIDGQLFKAEEAWCRRDELSTYPSYSIAGARTVEGGIQSLEVYCNGFGVGVPAKGTYDLFSGSLNTCTGVPLDDIYCTGNITSGYFIESGSITFSEIDEAKQIVSGSFQFTATQATPPGDGKIEVTEGQFLVKYVIGQNF